MDAKKWMLAISCLIFAVLNGSGVRAEAPQSACISCHKVLGGTLAMPVTNWQHSVHHLEKVGCDRCHGGDATVQVGNVFTLTGQQFAAIKAASMSQAKGFLGKPSGQVMFDVCSRCHAPMVAMYTQSIMGKAYLQNKGGPSCTRCHNAHNNVMPAVPKVCMQCHKDTSGFTEINPMDVTPATITQLSRIRVRLAGQTIEGARPAVAPGFTGGLHAYEVGLMAFGGILVLFLICYAVYVILEKEK